MFLCLAKCFSAYISRFSCAKNFEKKFFFKGNFFFQNFFFVKSCGSLTAVRQGGTFSFAMSITFTALPMHCCCTIADLGSFCFGCPR